MIASGELLKLPGAQNERINLKCTKCHRRVNSIFFISDHRCSAESLGFGQGWHLLVEGSGDLVNGIAEMVVYGIDAREVRLS